MSTSAGRAPVSSSVIAIGRIQRRARRAALVGNPNVGKSSLFNALTGLHQRVSNYPGTTVERLVGRCSAQGGSIEIVDLPGTYSLLPRSPDEEVVRDQLLGRGAGDAAPDVVVVVLDATNLERSLFLASQVLELGRPVVAALNQVDLAVERGNHVDADLLAERLGVPVVPTCGRTAQGRDALAAAVLAGGGRGRVLELAVPDEVRREAAALAPSFEGVPGVVATPDAVARLLMSEADACDAAAALTAFGRTGVATELRHARARLAAAGVDAEAGTATARYEAISRLLAGVATDGPARSWRTNVDRLLLHPVTGTAAMFATFALVFVAILSWAPVVGDLVGDGIGAAGAWAAGLAHGGLLGNFLERGVFAGLGSFLVFVPQIAVFFLMLELLDDTGYLARAAFLLDKMMGRFGLPGRAFLPLLSGFACAIPGVMATRTISNFRDRMVTMAVLPLMSCSARMPVYLLVIAVVFSGAAFWVGPAVVMSMYVLGIVVALCAATVLRRTVLRGGRTPLLLELPPYRAPVLKSIARNVGRRTWAFVAGAGPTIFVLSLVLWGLLTFPRDVTLSRDFDAEAAPHEAALAEANARNASDAELQPLQDAVAAIRNPEEAERREQSYLGRMGKAIEPAIRPLGFDWKIGVGILGSFAAREVFVSTLGVIYAAGENVEAEDASLTEKLRTQRWPSGRAVYTPLSGVSLCVFYILAMQCMSTLAILRRESGGWRWPVGIFVALTILAYAGSLAVYQGGLALGF